ncbi:MAG TPA: hypothetical protein VF676_03945 [Flavobacterium sp.]|jgi:hypothetical protein
MKKTLFAICTALLIIGCSSDDNNDDNNGPVTGAVYLPLSTGNYWTYDVDATSNSGRDSLYVENDTVINNETFKRMETENLAFGFYSGSLRNNGARYSDGAVLVSGNSGLNLGFGEAFNINLALNNFVLLRENASVNQQLSSVSGEIEQDYEGYPLVIGYTLKSTAKESLASYTAPNGETYSDVKSVQLTLNMSISTTMDVFGVPFTVDILAPQDVVVSTSYFARDIGMVHANTLISYELEDFSDLGFELPIPSTGTEVQVETLDTFSVE